MIRLIELRQYQVALDSNAPAPVWAATVEDDAGQHHEQGPWDHSPTDDELVEGLLPPPVDLTPTTSKAVLLPIMKQRILEAQSFDWFNTKVQADGALTAPQKKAVAALNTTLYQRARAAVAAWYAAS